MNKGNAEKICTASMQDLVPLMTELLQAGQTVRFTPKGYSMLPMLREGRDSVLLSPVPEKLKKYDLALYRRDNGAYVLHRIVGVGENYTCLGDNQFILEPNLRRDQFVALVTGFRRNGCDYSVNHSGYRMYCRIWFYSRGIRHFIRRARGWLRRHLK